MLDHVAQAVPFALALLSSAQEERRLVRIFALKVGAGSQFARLLLQPKRGTTAPHLGVAAHIVVETPIIDRLECNRRREPTA